MSSFHEISVAIKVCVDVLNILQKGGFFQTIMQYFKLYQQILSLQKLTGINPSVNDIPIEQALQILWNPKTDTLYIKYTLKPVLATKRGILSLISSVFDPLGLIAPTLIEPKWIVR